MLTRRNFLYAASASGLLSMNGAQRLWGQVERRERTRRPLQGLPVIVHRGASEFAHENTLEAYRASLELGADGNEIDIRETRDGVLVCFHDDMLDHLLEAYGDVRDYEWSQLRTFPFRRPGRFGPHCRIPTLEEVLQLHVEHAGLLHLDIKQPGIGSAIGKALDRFDLWEAVVSINRDHGEGLLLDERYCPQVYKGSLYAERAEVDPAAIAGMLKRSGEMVIVDDPRGVLVHLGRPLGNLSESPVSAQEIPPPTPRAERDPAELLALIQDRQGWDEIPRDDEASRRKAEAIRRRAEAAEEVRSRGIWDDEVARELVTMVRQRSFHPEWQYHGLDGAAALRALAHRGNPDFPAIAREALWRDDASVESVADPRWSSPRAWTDFRTKVIVFSLLEQVPGEPSERVCRDYLALSDELANRLAPPQFEAAAATLLAIRPEESVARELLTHRRMDVRGRAILTCVARHEERWAHASLRALAPHALRYIVT